MASRRFEDGLGGLFHGVDRGAEFAGRARHAAFFAFADEGGEFTLIAGDGFVQSASSSSSVRRPCRVGDVGSRACVDPAARLLRSRLANIRSTRKTLRCMARPTVTPRDFYPSGD